MKKKPMGPIGKELERVLVSILAAEQLAFINYHNKQCSECPYNPDAPQKGSKLK